MKKFLLLAFLFIIPETSFSHASHYKDFKKIEMEIFKDGKKIGESIYEFNYLNDILNVTNKTNFEVKLLGIKIFSIQSNSLEQYQNDKLISYSSRTLQNDKKKFVDLKYNEQDEYYKIKGSSFSGEVNSEYIIGNWWNHKILQSETQISPLSGSIKDQIVNFIKKEKITVNGNEYIVHKFSLKSKDENLNQNKKLDFILWLEPKKNVIIKVRYEKMGTWEYILKDVIMK